MHMHTALSPPHSKSSAPLQAGRHDRWLVPSSTTPSTSSSKTWASVLRRTTMTMSSVLTSFLRWHTTERVSRTLRCWWRYRVTGCRSRVTVRTRTRWRRRRRRCNTFPSTTGRRHRFCRSRRDPLRRQSRKKATRGKAIFSRSRSGRPISSLRLLRSPSRRKVSVRTHRLSWIKCLLWEG